MQKLQKDFFSCLTATFKRIPIKNDIEFKEWEIKIPTYGKSHPQLAFRPYNLKDLKNE